MRRNDAVSKRDVEHVTHYLSDPISDFEVEIIFFKTPLAFLIGSIRSRDIALPVLAISLILRYPKSPYSREVQKVL